MNSTRVLLLVGGTAPHDYPGSIAAISEALRQESVTVTATEQNATLDELPLGRFDVVFLFIDGPRLDDSQIQSLVSFVREGGGLVAIHSTAGANENSEAFGKLVGSRIKKGIFVEYKVSVADPDHSIAQGLGEFHLDDEVYALEPTADNQIFLTSKVDGKCEPIGYSRMEGKGRVVYLAAGHKVETFRHPVYRALVGRSVRFTCGRAISRR